MVDFSYKGNIMRLRDKTAIVIGAGQGPGTGMGNGRATVIRFAQEGAAVLAVDRDLASAQETCAMAAKDGQGGCEAYEADVTSEASMRDMIAQARDAWGRIDILHYNVGVSLAGGDAAPDAITEEAFDRVVTINLRGMVMACKHVLPLMRAQKPGVILGISSIAAIEEMPRMTPDFCARMTGSTCLQAITMPRRLTVMTRSKASSVIASGAASPPASDTPTL